ncbi:cytidine deaminase family protein [Nakamurella endophytica]|uniref:Cytidine deaminase n=1 Tax=Nakamurella endophytica TaxID=1748367 RepID=A0A917SKS7_9ACTN|nr:cytidine deaminase [Nakamurella endophytica]GGL85309.1 cytidine deaminase [Nakamurella endophytica]
MTEAWVDALISAAARALRPRERDGLWVADVACALRDGEGAVHTGASVAGYLGVCAEQGAVSAMVTRADPRVTAIVAVWRDPDGRLHVLPPCGRCREFLRLLHPGNLDAQVVLGHARVLPLRRLLPWHGWHAEPAD